MRRDVKRDFSKVGLTETHPNAMAPAGESVGPRGTLVIDHAAREKGEEVVAVGLSKEVRLRPHMQTLMSSAYSIGYAALEQLKTRLMSGEPFRKEEAGIYRALVASIVELSREERHQLSAFEAEQFSTEDIIEVLNLAKERGLLPSGE